MKASLDATFKQNDTAAWKSLRAFVDANPTPADTIFNHLFSPSAEAKFGLYHFVEKHFPRESHINRPRDKKTPYAIALPTYRGGERMVERRVNDRGVRLFAGGHDYIEHTNVVGWAVNGTRALANKYDNHAFNLRFRNREAELKRLYDEHRLFCANQPVYTGSGQENELLRLEGHYILRCDKVVSIYDISNVMTMDITTSPHIPNAILPLPRRNPSLRAITAMPVDGYPLEERGILASFDLGVLKGTMAIVNKPFVLDSLRHQQTDFNGWPFPDDCNRRVWFEWRGENGHGNFQLREHPDHIGYMDFDRDGTYFQGVFGTEQFGKESRPFLMFSGYKIDNVARAVPRGWDSFDPMAVALRRAAEKKAAEEGAKK